MTLPVSLLAGSAAVPGVEAAGAPFQALGELGGAPPAAAEAQLALHGPDVLGRSRCVFGALQELHDLIGRAVGDYPNLVAVHLLLCVQPRILQASQKQVLAFEF